jgi:uncharacterized caspase-like protein
MANNWAIVVGINEYEHLPQSAHLKFAVRDAQEVKNFLCDRAKFLEEQVLLCSNYSETLNNLSTRPSRSNLRRLLRDEIQRAKEVDNFWFFFGGHGAVGTDNQDYLLPCDAYHNDLEETSISTTFVTECLRRCDAKNIVLVLDMCRNEGIRSGVRGYGGEVGTQTSELAEQQGIITLFSCSRNEYSYEITDLEHGAFTYTLLEGLEQYTNPRQLEEYLRKEVPKLNHQYSKPSQTPLIKIEPGWKYDLPLLPECATQADVTVLKECATHKEKNSQIQEAIELWWQVIEISLSSAQNKEARQEIERLQQNPTISSVTQFALDPSTQTRSIPETNSQDSQTPVPPLLPKPHSLESGKSKVSPTKQKRKLPEGWDRVNQSFLNQRSKKITKDSIIQYFDGHEPDWKEAMSDTIKPRNLVNELIEILNREREHGLRLTLLVGPGGEGKSTAIRQVVCHLVADSNSGFKIIWWEDPEIDKLRINLKFLPACRDKEKWLIVADDPSQQLIKEIYGLFSDPLPRRDFQFLLCCRETAWQSYGEKLRWDQRRTKIAMPKLRKEEAQRIVEAWKELGELTDKSEEEAVRELMEKQKSEKAALLAAMLQVRRNETLEGRVKRILQDIEGISEQSKIEYVLDAYACIAAMHAEGFKFLKQRVLAAAIKYDTNKLRSDILEKLGAEIIVSHEDRPILIRHQTIAETAVKKLRSSPYEKNFEFDIYPRLAKSAQELWERGDLGEKEITQWRYDFPKHFADDEMNPRISLAIRIAEALYEVGKSPQLFTHLAQLYRKDQRFKQVIRLFRECSFSKNERDRKFYDEWATAERDFGNYENAVWLCAVALSDGIPPSQPSEENAMIYLSNMGYAFYKLCKQPGDIYAEALDASAQLGLNIAASANYKGKARTIIDLKKNLERATSLKTTKIKLDPSLEKIQRGIEAAYQRAFQEASQDNDKSLPNWVKKVNELEFRGLNKVLRVNKT